MSDYLTDGNGGSEKTFPPNIQKRIDAGLNCWSSIGKGWLQIILDLDEELSKLDPNYTIDQIKEKFGTLRFYASGFDGVDYNLVSKAIELAETRSSRTCDICGKPGKLCGKGWLVTRCEEHEPTT